MEVGEIGIGGGSLGNFYFFLGGGIRNACMLLAELYIDYTVSMYSDTLDVLQNLPSSLIALDKKLEGWFTAMPFAWRFLSSWGWMARKS